jgi:hypothetical protein
MDKITISIRFEQVNDLHMGHFEAALGRLPPLRSPVRRAVLSNLFLGSGTPMAWEHDGEILGIS